MKLLHRELKTTMALAGYVQESLIGGIIVNDFQMSHDRRYSTKPYLSASSRPGPCASVRAMTCWDGGIDLKIGRVESD